MVQVRAMIEPDRAQTDNGAVGKRVAVAISADSRLLALLGRLRRFRYTRSRWLARLVRYRGGRLTDRHAPAGPKHGSHEEERERKFHPGCRRDFQSGMDEGGNLAGNPDHRPAASGDGPQGCRN